MKNKLRVSLLSALCATGFVTANSRPSFAQPAKVADEHNTAGKALFKERRYLEAYRRFKQAVALSPEGRFYFNVCFSLNYLERFQEAIEACEAVEAHGADAKLMQKTNAVLEALRAKVPAPNNGGTTDPNNGGTTDPNNGGTTDPNNGGTTDPNNGGTTDPNNGGTTDPNNGGTTDPNNGGTTDPNNGGTTDPNNGGSTTPNTGTGPATVPGLDPFAAKAANGAYAWALGVTGSPLINLGVGENDAGAFYAGSGLGLNVFANFMYKPEQQIGLQAYVSVGNLPPEDSEFFDPLTVVDLGGAIYKHIPINDKIDITPLVGLHVSIMQPDPSFEEGLLAIGARLQASVDYHLGSKQEHVVSFAPGINLYSPASDTSVIFAEDFGLDSGGATFEVGFSYQYRFTTPFGSSPLFTLE